MKARKIATAPARGLKAISSMMFGRGSGMLWRFLPRTRFDYAREVGDGMGSSLIMAPILWMARTFPEAPIQVLDSEDQAVDRHAMVTLLRRPNPYYSGLVMWMGLLLSWVVDGNAYLLKIRYKNTSGVGQLWYVPHWVIEPKSDSNSEFITHYEYRVDGQHVRLEVEDVVHLRYGLDPYNPRKGLSPLGSVLREVFSDDEAANFAAALLKNVGVPGLIVAPEKGASSPSPDDVEATKNYVKDNFTGDKRGQPLVMSGATTVTQFGFSPEQMTVRDLRRVPEERVTAVLGLPAIIVGFGAGLERSTFANFAEAREAAYESNMVPLWRLFAEELRNQLLPDFEERPDDFEVAFDLKQVRALQEDRNKEAERFGTLYKDGVISRAEARIGVGEEAAPEDEVYAVPIAITLLPVGQALDEPEPDEPDPTDEPAEPDDPKLRGAKGLTRRQGDALYEAFKRDADRLAGVLAGELEKDLDALGHKAAEEYERVAGKQRKDVSDAEEAAAVDQVVTALALDDWKQATLVKRLEVHYARTSEMTLKTINTVLELGTDLPDMVARGIMRAGGTRAGLIDIADQTKEAIFRALTEAREAGEGPVEAARRIRQYVPAGRFVNAGPKYRAELIARTETLNAQRLSSLGAYREAPSVTAVMLFDGRLAGSDVECAARDGEIVSFDEAQALAYDEHPNGSLSFGPVTA